MAARKQYKVTRPSDNQEFTFLLSEEDAQKYRDADWKVSQQNGGATVKSADLAAPGNKGKARPAKAEK